MKASPGGGAKKPPETAPANRFKAKGRHFHFCPAKNVMFLRDCILPRQNLSNHPLRCLVLPCKLPHTEFLLSSC